MNSITAIASSLALWQYILLYAGLFILAIIIAAVGGSKIKSIREGIIALLAFFGGFLAVEYVGVKLDNKSGLLQFIMFVVFASIIGVLGATISAQTPDTSKESSKTTKSAQKKKQKRVKPTAEEIRQEEIAKKVEKLTLKDIDSITDEAILCAYVRRYRSTSLVYPAIKKISSDQHLASIAQDSLVDRKIRIYALEHIQSDEIKAALVRKQKDKWLTHEAAYSIKSKEIRFELFKEFPRLYSPSSSNPLIFNYVLKNHLYADDSMDVFNISENSHEKGSVYVEALKSGNPEFIQMLDLKGWEELTELCFQNIKKYGHQESPPSWQLTESLNYLKLIYHAGLCKSKNTEIEALDGQTFNRYDIVNYYDEREKCDGVTFHLHDAT